MSLIQNSIYKLKYKILAISSTESDSDSSSSSSLRPQPIINFENPWSSNRFCAYPQKIILKFETPVNLNQIIIISHEKRISQKITFSIFCPQLDDPVFSKVILNEIGYINLNQNMASNYQVRELKKIFVNVKCLFLRMELDQNYINDYNPYHQVSLINLEFYGTKLVGYYNINISLRENYERGKKRMIEDETKDNNDEYNEILNEICGEQLKYLNNKLLENNKSQNYKECIKFKELISKVRDLGNKIYNLEKEKNDAVNIEDYDKATELKDEIDKLKLQIYNLGNTDKKIPNNTQNKNIDETNNMNNSSIVENINAQNTNNNFMSNNTSRSFDNMNTSEKMSPRRTPQKNIISNIISERDINTYNNTQADMNYNSMNNFTEDHDSMIVPALLNKMKNNKTQEDIELEYEEQKQKERSGEKEKILVELTKDQLEQYNLLIPYIEIIGLQKLLSKYIKYKLEGIEILKEKLSNIFIASEINEIMPVLLELISNLLEDNNFKSLKTFELIEQLFQYININKDKNLINNDLKNFIINRIMERIIHFLSDGDKIIRKQAKELYFFIIKQNIINFNSLIYILLNPDIQNKDNELYVVSSLSILSKLKLIKKILLNYDLLKSGNIITEESFPKDLVVSYLIQYLFHPRNKIKEKCRKVSLKSFEILGAEIWQIKLYLLNQSDLDNLSKIKELEPLMNSLANFNPMQISKNLKKNKSNKNMNMNICSLCKENLGKLDMNNHMKICKMCINCNKCNNFVEIKNLTKHRLNDCKYKNEFKLCDRCKEAVEIKEFVKHTEKKKCNIYKSNYNRCPLCHKDINYGNKGFYQHLVFEGCSEKK